MKDKKEIHEWTRMNTNKRIDDLLIRGEIEEVMYEGHEVILE